MNKLLLTTIVDAVDRHNIEDFRKAMSEGFDVNTRVPTRTGSMSFIERVARARFTNALRVLMLETCPCQVSRNDAAVAFHACVQSGAPKAVVEIFIQASIAKMLPVLSLTECFQYAMQHLLPKTAIDVVNTSGFDPNCSIQLSNGIWERPIHLAIKNDDLETARQLLQVGAEVDAHNSYNTSSLFIACTRMNFDCCHILISYGANPRLTKPWYLGPTTLLESLYGIDRFRSALSCWKEQPGAKRIIALLVKAGLPQSQVLWLQHKVESDKLSNDAAQGLKEISFRLLTLKELSVISGRELVRLKRTGQGSPGFHDLIDQLSVPGCFREMLKFESFL